MFNIVGGWNPDKPLYWTGRGFTQVRDNRQEYKTERAAIAVARRLKLLHPSMFVEIADQETGQTILLIVVHNDVISTALPQRWEELKKHGFTR